jgi:hypothetical protein
MTFSISGALARIRNAELPNKNLHHYMYAPLASPRLIYLVLSSLLHIMTLTIFVIANSHYDMTAYEYVVFSALNNRPINQ